MSNRKNRNKLKQISAAEVLTTSEVSNNAASLLPGTKDLDVGCLAKILKFIEGQLGENTKFENTLLAHTKMFGDVIKSAQNSDKIIQRLVGSIEDLTSMATTQTKELKDLKLANIVKQKKQPSSETPHTDENAALKVEMQQLRKENQALRSSLEASKLELRTLKDEFLMNLERQNDNTLVIHGISESVDETSIKLEEEVNQIISSSLSVPTPCAEAFRIGKKGASPRVIKVRWDNQKHCRMILENHKNLPSGIFVNKDRPFLLREARRKIREKAKELWANKIEYEYRDLGLIYNGEFHHYTELDQSGNKVGESNQSGLQSDGKT
jgi:hypothetical protein